MSPKKTRRKISSKSSKRKFNEKDFVKKVWKTMEGQAKANPEIALLHERLEGKIRLIGLTGGIASGKSLIADFLTAMEIPVIDADQIAREVVAPKKKAYRQIIASFGEGILNPDRTIDRKRLGEIVFADEPKRVLLESMTHPEIMKEIVKRVKALKKEKSKLAVVDAALLFESDLHRQMHKNILVRINPEVQLKRLVKRDRLPENQAWQRILSQMPTPQKEKVADFVIDNSGSPEETQRQILRIIDQLK